MIYVPGVGTAITGSSGGTDPRWATALHYSGFNLTTLGVSNHLVAAAHEAYRQWPGPQGMEGHCHVNLA
jgi:hypothetical protein